MKKRWNDGRRSTEKRVGDLRNRVSLVIFEKVMTKVTILGKSQGEEPKKKIEFIKYLNSSGVTPAHTFPYEYDNIELVARNYTEDLDLMYAYDEGCRDTTSSTLYLGHFNDGVV